MAIISMCFINPFRNEVCCEVAKISIMNLMNFSAEAREKRQKTWGATTFDTIQFLKTDITHKFYGDICISSH